MKLTICLLALSLCGSAATFTSDGVTVQVERFPAAASGKNPSVIFLYGADGLAVQPWRYRSVGRWFAEQGYNFYLVHYFDGTTVLGQQPITARVFGTWVRVVSDATTWVEQQPEADANRISLMGTSLGCTLAISAAAVDYRIKALAAWYGAEPTWYQEQIGQPIVHLPPTVIVHGENDRLSPMENVYAFQTLLQRLGTQVQMYIFPDEGHVLDPANQVIALAKTLAFFQQHQ